MSTSMPDALRGLDPEPNPYTDASPLVVRDHPWRDNRPVLAIAAVVALVPLVWLAARALTDSRPLWIPELILAVSIGLPLGAVMALFPLLVSTGVRVRLDDGDITRTVRRGAGGTKTIPLSALRGGIYASQVRYRREMGRELILVAEGGEVLWIADGVRPDDVERLARALSTYGIKEYAEPIGTEKLRQLVAAARKAEAGSS